MTSKNLSAKSRPDPKRIRQLLKETNRDNDRIRKSIARHGDIYYQFVRPLEPSQVCATPLTMNGGVE